MNAVVEAPRKVVESFAALRLPATADRRLQELMDRNNNGKLSADERDQLEVLVELSEKLALVRADALLLLGRKPT